MEKEFTYILTNKNATVLYVGATKNLKNRIDCHRNGTGAVFTKNYNATILIYFVVFDDLSDAFKRKNNSKIGIKTGNGILQNFQILN